MLSEFETIERTYGPEKAGDLRKALHFLLVMNERAEAADRIALADRLFDHVDRAFHAEAKSVFVGQ